MKNKLFLFFLLSFSAQTLLVADKNAKSDLEQHSLLEDEGIDDDLFDMAPTIKPKKPSWWQQTMTSWGVYLYAHYLKWQKYIAPSKKVKKKAKKHKKKKKGTS